MPTATRVVAELEEKFGDKVAVTLIKGDRGVFDVRLGDTLIYSKHEADRFPDPGEIGKLIEQRS